jgi:hypothetical protein
VATVPPSLVRWAFHSPLRLLGVSLAVVAVLVGGVGIAATLTQGPGKPARATSQPVSTPAPTVIPDPLPSASESLSARDRRTATRTARAFVNAWAKDGQQTKSRTEWLRTMRALTTASLFRGLKFTDPAALPTGRVEQVHLKTLGAFSADFTVTLTTGLRVAVQAVAEGGKWAVADIRPVGA